MQLRGCFVPFSFPSRHKETLGQNASCISFEMQWSLTVSLGIKKVLWFWVNWRSSTWSETDVLKPPLLLPLSKDVTKETLKLIWDGSWTFNTVRMYCNPLSFRSYNFLVPNLNQTVTEKEKSEIKELKNPFPSKTSLSLSWRCVIKWLSHLSWLLTRVFVAFCSSSWSSSGTTLLKRRRGSWQKCQFVTSLGWECADVE